MITWVNNDLFEVTAIMHFCHHAGAKDHLHQTLNVKSWGVVNPSRRAEDRMCNMIHMTCCLWTILIFIACEFHQTCTVNRIGKTAKLSWFPQPWLSYWLFFLLPTHCSSWSEQQLPQVDWGGVTGLDNICLIRGSLKNQLESGTLCSSGVITVTDYSAFWISWGAGSVFYLSISGCSLKYF